MSTLPPGIIFAILYLVFYLLSIVWLVCDSHRQARKNGPGRSFIPLRNEEDIGRRLRFRALCYGLPGLGLLIVFWWAEMRIFAILILLILLSCLAASMVLDLKLLLYWEKHPPPGFEKTQPPSSQL